MIRCCLLIASYFLSTSALAAAIECPENTLLKGNEPPNGIELRCETSTGILHGPYKRWYGNGQLNQQMNYINGQEHGEQKAWWPNGTLMMKGISVDGQRFKGYEYWDMQGNKINVEFNTTNKAEPSA